jgi:putative ABC transport system permease protein
MPETNPTAPVPRLPLALLHLLLPRAERDELLGDIVAEYREMRAQQGEDVAGRWLWRQAVSSAPALLSWTWWRGRSGFEPRANAYRPGGNLIKHWMTDARYAARRLRTRPVYSLLAVLTLALGIGGTAAVFGIARPLLFDPLPYANADQVAAFWRSGWWNEQEFTYMRDKFAGFQKVATYRPMDVTIRDGDAPTRLLTGIAASHELFDVLGARPHLGRTFQAGEDVVGAERVVVLSWGLWQELGGTQQVVGQRITLDNTPHTVIGVMPRGFWYPNPAVRVWTAHQINPEGRNGSYTTLGLVEPGRDPANMGPQLAQIVKLLGERFTYSERGDKTKDAWLKPLREDLLGSMKPAVVATFVAMALILLIACVNVAALMLGQVEGRASELAVRSALGATHARITQQLVVEALLLGVASGLAGAGFAAAGFRMLAQALPIGAWAEAAQFDWSMFAAALAVAIAAVLLVVLVPTFSLWRGGMRGALSAGRTGGVQGRGGRLERGLVVAEVALAMLIASGAALLVRSVNNLYAIRPGFETRGLAVVDVLTSRTMDGNERVRAINRIITALEQLPGVQSAASAMRIPLRGRSNSSGFAIEGREPPAGTWPLTYFRIASPGYFATMGIRLRDGQLFTGNELWDVPDDGEMQVVVNEALAAKYFPNENPVGKRVRGVFGQPQRIIGVVSNVQEAALVDEAEPVRYYLQQQGMFGSSASFVIRMQRPGDAEAVLDEARSAVQRVAPEFAVQEVTTMDRVLDTAVGPARQVMSLLTLLSALALVLGAVGIYGVISHFAARRQRDWAIRVALGLPGSRVMTHIVRQGVVLALLGIVIGALGAAALTRLLSTFLHGVSSVDPVAFAAASAALLLIGAMAAFVPARRAGMTDPALVLREQ